MTVCSIAGCGRKRHAHGFCGMHFQRWNRTGDPLKTRWSPWGEGVKFLKAAIKYREDDCLLWPFQCDQLGHARVYWEGRKQRCARIVCEEAHGKPPSKRHEATHLCGNGHLGCINPSHLRWNTHAGNMVDMVKHGRSNRGVKNPGAKLTEADVREISSLKGQLTQAQIAHRFGVDQSTISNIFRGRYWGWLKSHY
jgi:HNH endonuclease